MDIDRESSVSRRDLVKIATRFGITSTAIAAAGLTGGLTASRLADAANSVNEKRFSKKAKFTLRFGGAGFNEISLGILRTGYLEFVRDLEERTDGEIRVEFIGSNQICGELDCVKKAQQSIVDIFGSSTQNAAASAPYYNALDFAYMFPSRASQYHFFYHPKSNELFRQPLRSRHNLHFLFTNCDHRGIMLGLGWKDRPTVTRIEELFGTKNRVTGTQLGRIAMTLLQLNPVPIAWEETLDGLKQGLIDGAEAWSAAAAAFNMAPVVSQVVQLKFFPAFEHAAMRASVFDKLDGPLQDALMESAYFTQVKIQAAQEATLNNKIGAYSTQKPGTIFAKSGTRIAELSDEELRKAEKMCSPEFVPEPWAQWRERINKWSGGHDVYKEIHSIARELPRDTLAEDVEPRRWWKS